MEVTLLGTGDTTGTPTVGCDCATCRTARDRGIERSRFSVHVQHDDRSLLVDASPDFRHQFLEHGTPLPDAVLITHIHFDHLDGLGNAYRLYDSLDVYATDVVDPHTDRSVADTIRTRYDYLDRLTIHDVSPFEPTRICGLDVTFVPVDHPPVLCYGLAITDPESGAKLGLSGDTSYAIPEASRRELDDPELLLADAIVPAELCEYHPKGGRHHAPDGTPRTFGTKHMTREGALDLADDLNATQTRLVHLAHFYPADQAFTEPLAIDGEQYSL